MTLTGRRERVRGVALAVCDDGVAATSSAECGRRAVAAVHGHPCISRTSPTSYRGAPHHASAAKVSARGHTRCFRLLVLPWACALSAVALRARRGPGGLSRNCLHRRRRLALAASRPEFARGRAARRARAVYASIGITNATIKHRESTLAIARNRAGPHRSGDSTPSEADRGPRVCAPTHLPR